MSESAERLVNLALLLASSPRHVTAEQCRSAGLGYPEGQDEAAFLRMFERDKDALRAAGLVIDVARDQDTDVEAYRLNANATYARPLDLEPDEVSALQAVAAALTEDPAFPFRDDLALALGKLGASSHDRPLATTELADVAPERGPIVRALAEAVRMRKAVTFDYTNSTGAKRRRSVDPYGLFFREGQWYLTGLDTTVGDVRTYAIDRIEGLDVNPLRPRTPDFERPGSFDVGEQERLPFQYGEAAVAARVRFEPDSAWRAERLSRGHGTVELLADGSAVWTVEAANLRRLAEWIVDQGQGLHAVEPPELLETLAQGLRRVIDAHG